MNYQGMRKEIIMRHTQHDIIRDNVHDNLKQINNYKKYNYDRSKFNEVKELDLTASDYYFNKTRFLLKIKHNTKDKNNFLRIILSRRSLNKEEEKRFNLLKKRGLASRDQSGLTCGEEKELYVLKRVRFAHPAHRAQQLSFKGLNEIYFYKNASVCLKKPNFIEYNGNRTCSKEKRITVSNVSMLPDVNIIVSKEDAVDFTVNIRRKKNNAILINCASHLCPGASWEKGEEGYEESIFYRSSYDLSLNGEGISDGFYPLIEESTLYSPKVMIYKFGRNHKYAQKPKAAHPDFIPIIAACALHNPEYKKIKKRKNGKIEITINENLLSKKHSIIYKDKIKNVLQTAIYWGHDTIIFNSFGCVEKGHPAKHCASLFKEVIFDEKYKFYKKIIKIIFCIGIKSMSDVPRPTNSMDKSKFIYETAHKEFVKEQNIYKIFYQVLHGVDG
jgi:hypothetical protein